MVSVGGVRAGVWLNSTTLVITISNGTAVNASLTPSQFVFTLLAGGNLQVNIEKVSVKAMEICRKKIT